MIKLNIAYSRNLKQALNHGLVLKKVHRVVKFNQNARLKPYIDMNTDLRKKLRNDFEKDFYKLANNAVFQETMENTRNYRYIKLVTTERRRNYLLSEPNYHTKNLLAIEMRKTEILMSNLVYLGVWVVELRKILMYGFWYDYKELQTWGIWMVLKLLLNTHMIWIIFIKILKNTVKIKNIKY